MSTKKYQELEDIVLENTILIKKNRALVSINHDNLHGAYRESYDVTRELLLLQLERARKFINDKSTHINLFEYLKKRIEINKKTASVTEKIISSNEIMMEALEESKVVNEELVKFLEVSLSKYKKNNTTNRKKSNKKKITSYSEKEINELFNLQKENILNIFRNNSRINHNRKKIQDKIAEVELISKKAQDLVANFHHFLYED
ncbi:MAG: hypothetical protein CFH34_00428 [Alphaproteobacteria bacterium MarineAlpha9_Bin4]|nr:hypothetical protein [Pelagibacterales bacterium]PPR27151.1 MAG: hypothetical protein CFH34_00428 [Alphaproteobacteria bacterium MarineAlpha9_Bin4]|tara:strand:+ start:4241 stop:4849 length:609 start_codon:yes stop_codon:yes gene_type:complete